MSIKVFILLALAVALQAQDTKPLATVEELTKQVAEQQKEIAKLRQKLTIYQQSAFRCQDAMLDAQIDAQAKQRPAKPATLATPVQPQSSVAEQPKESDAKPGEKK